MTYRRTGRSGLDLPAVSLGLWHNFGDDVPLDRQRATLRRAFDLGVTHFDLANNYGPPYGSAERNFGTIYAQDFKRYRDELILSTKAGYDMWPGPYGQGGGSRKYVLSSLDQSLAADGRRLRRHLLLPPLRRDDAARGDDGRARHRRPSGQGAVCRHLLLLGPAHQGGRRDPARAWARRCSSTSRATRCSTAGSRRTCSTCSARRASAASPSRPLAQGMLTDKYLDGVPAGSRASQDKSLSTDLLTEQNLTHIRALNGMAKARGQSLAQMALAWILRDQRVTSVLIGASSVGQLEDSLGSLDNLEFTHRGARPDRPARRRGRHQPLEDLERPLTDGVCRVAGTARRRGPGHHGTRHLTGGAGRSARVRCGRGTPS